MAITEIPAIRRAADRDLLREQLDRAGCPVPEDATYYSDEEWRSEWGKRSVTDLLPMTGVAAARGGLGVFVWPRAAERAVLA